MFTPVEEKLLDIFEGIIKWMYESFVAPFIDLPTLKNLIYGKYKEGDLVWGTFEPSNLTEALNPIYYTMMTLSGFFIVAFIILYGIRISGAPLNPQKRTDSIELIKDLVLVGIVLLNLPTLYDLMFTVNQGIVNAFNGAYESALDDLGNEEEDEGILGWLFVQLILLGLMVWANFYYMMRKLTLIILMGMGPLMMAFWLHPQFKPITSSWLKELTGSIFVQSIHAFVFWTVATLSSSSSGFIETVIVYLIFIPISESIRRLLLMGGEMQGGLAKAGAMLGLGALSGMYGAVKGAIGDKSVTSALKGAYQGLKDQKAGGADSPEEKNAINSLPGTDVGTTTTANKMLKAGEIFSRGGKAVFGMAGAVAGSPMGPVSAIIGATGASAVGGVMGGAAGRVGTAALQGIAERHKKGVENKNATAGKNDDGFEENFANQIAEQDTASWAATNKTSELARLQELHPDATPEQLENKFQQIAAQKRAGFYQDAKRNFASISNKDNGKFANGDSLVGTTSQAMAENWGANNQNDFFNNYDKTNPQKDGEKLEDFQVRRMNAFINKKDEMRLAFANKGNEVISQMGAVDGAEPVSKTEFANRLASSIGGIKDVGNTTGLSSAAQQAVSHVQGESVLNPKGKGNVLFLASRMANLQTEKMKEGYISEQTAQGINQSTAEQQWESIKPAVHRANLNKFNESAQAANNLTYSSGLSKGIEWSSQKGANLAKWASGFSGASGFVQGTNNLSEAVQSGMKSFSSTMAVSSQFGSTGIVSQIKGFKQASVDAVNTTIGTIAEQAGGAVAAQSKLQNATGYTTGMFFGAAGYQVGKSVVSRVSPFKQAVQEQIKSPSEVMQMAQTVTDENGNTRIAPGAVRQVITPNESYVEVRTKSGTSQVVSRKGAGHSGLRKGDVIYQDLEMQGDSLMVASPKNGGSSSYRMDSGGGRVPSSIMIAANPNELLGSPRVSNTHRPITRNREIPSYSQSVDNGQFYIEDLKNHGMENMQVVVEKDRQFVTGQKGGVTYRVSPVYAGDTRMSKTESINIPVSIKNNKLAPTNPVVTSQVAVHSNMVSLDDTNISGDTNAAADHQYYSSQTVGSLMVSRDALRAQRSLNKRQELDQVRRKQGLLG